jgi:hypothetical protein
MRINEKKHLRSVHLAPTRPAPERGNYELPEKKQWHYHDISQIHHHTVFALGPSATSKPKSAV